MNVHPEIDRRTLLRWLMAVTLLARGRPSVARESGERGPNLFSARASAVILGNAYLQLRPEESNPETLLRRLRISGPVLNEAAGREGIPSVLRQRHHDDFANGRIIEMQGWFLSETELRLSALVCLSERTSSP